MSQETFPCPLLGLFPRKSAVSFVFVIWLYVCSLLFSVASHSVCCVEGFLLSGSLALSFPLCSLESFVAWVSSAAVEKVDAPLCSGRFWPSPPQPVWWGPGQTLSLLPSCVLLKELSMQRVSRRNSCIGIHSSLKQIFTCGFYCLGLYSFLGTVLYVSECCTLPVGSNRGKCALHQACLFTHTDLIASGCCVTEPSTWIRLFLCLKGY